MPKHTLLSRQKPLVRELSDDDLDAAVTKFLTDTKRIGRIAAPNQRIKPVVPSTFQAIDKQRLVDRIDHFAQSFGLRLVSIKDGKFIFKNIASS